MPRRASARAAWGLILLGQACATSVPATRTEAVAQTHAEVRLLTDDRDVTGVSYAQVSAHAVLFEASSGLADAVDLQPVTASTMFMACSMTKAFTAIAVLQLVERDRMALDAPLTRYVPDHPYGEGVTIRGLLAHTAGLPNPLPLDWFFVEGDAIDREGVYRRVLRDHAALDAAPGSEYGYSNIGYWLLEKAIESASGQPYEAYLREHVFGPVGVAPAVVSFGLPSRERMATGHIRQWSLLNLVLKVMAPSRYWLDSWHGWTRLARVQFWGLGYGGAVTSTAAFAPILSDLLRADGKLLNAATKARMFERQQAPPGEPIDGTLGWVTGELDGVRYLAKQGGCLGFQGNLRLYPTIGLGTVYLANTTAVSPGPIDSISDRLDGPLVRFSSREKTEPR